MGAFFVYILKSAVSLAMFYLFYRLLLSHETFHRFNRMALLSLLLLSCGVALVEITINQPTEISQSFIKLEEMLVTSIATDAETAKNDFSWREALLIIYIIGMVFFLFRNIWSLFQLWELVHNGNIQEEKDGVCVVTHKEKIAPFSWMKYIVISESDMEESGHEILLHERAHIQAHHSIDLLLADICILFQWFNPAAWLLKHELQTIHEYEADECVITQGVDAKKYQLLLIKKTVGTRLYSMANSLNHSSLKKRITMMMRKKSNQWARVKYLYVLPLAAITMAAFARPEVSSELKEISAVKVKDLSAIVKTEGVKTSKNIEVLEQKPEEKDKKIKMVYGYATPVESKAAVTATKTMKIVADDGPISVYTNIGDYEMAKFPGGNANLMQYLSENIKYPEAAKEKKEQGKVIILFDIEADGSINNIEIGRSVSPELDAEAMRVISSMPKWKPSMKDGKPTKIRHALPINFRLDTDSPGKSSTLSDDKAKELKLIMTKMTEKD